MSGDHGARLERARTAAEFVALMQELKDRSGLSYRQLEERAERRGEVLARSTIADGLRRRALPRAEVLAAFVRACGAGDDEVDAWLAARERIAAAPPEPDVDATSGHGDPAAAEPATAFRRRRGPGLPRLAAVGGAFAVLLAGTAWVLWPAGDAGDQSARVAFEDGWAEIRPSGAPGLCLTEGRDRSGRYEEAVAVQAPCGEAVPPRTYLRRAGENGVFSIEWVHPEHGRGCLTLRTREPAADMLEPWDDCSGDRAIQRFRFEPVGSPSAAYLIRSEENGRCLTIRNGERVAGAEAVVSPCRDAEDAQRFVVVPSNG
ncbi:RICIN domain-containing protein [Streptomyces sp. B6B3]|uniref:RICIN domain-containing protein n=1 Tax=Streptomyces sp. B6B3 TaxID=3153570 RepID=UPI00325F6B28